MAETKEVVLTYETLYEFMRREKSRAELQKLDELFFDDVLHYLLGKQQTYDENLAKNDIFSQGERDKLHIQIANIKKILKDLYDMRERKIINMAINRSRTGAHIPDTEHLLPTEQQLYDGLCTHLTYFRTGILHKMLEMRRPDIITSQPEAVPPPAPTTKIVVFKEPVEQFAGEELELYGPFEPEQVAELPHALADILIGQGKAIEQ